MRIGVVLAPVVDLSAMLAAARHADDLGFDAVGLWDHYHSPRPEWGYVAGWSAMAALATATQRVNIVPMVLNNLHFEPGVLAKESSTLALMTGGRFELAIGAGDWPESFAAWGRAYPASDERIARLEETVAILRRAWSGTAFDFDGRFNVIRGGSVTPAPQTPPRVVVGIGKSRALAESAVGYADELNVYADEAVVRRTQELIARSGRDVAMSLFLSWEWDKWPDNVAAEIERWRALGIERLLVSMGAADMRARVDQLAPLLAG
jgi:alkanesulfonate monooxygenase SsuD/methylene tetrahydromethanopterin reductase-like flavin-dependent oxidoreductase (luciferase family)